ncbi:MAG: hypothetical protein OEN01_11675 [Candidatus Krumholzibacteria bacterium]|nr:hypothetical protein [Candidatus Krumholzibacteria bacterium]
MKRALIALVAVLAVLLVYPATTPSAKSPGIDDSPTMHIITPGNGTGDYGSGQSGDDDEGDGDDLAGIKRGTRPTGNPDPVSGFITRSGAKIWWMYFLYHLRIMF